METWLSVPGNEQYMVSDHGRVAKLLLTKPGKKLPYIQFHVPVVRGSKVRKHHYLHDWILRTFVGPKPAGSEVRHLNGNPVDNRLENLAYGSRSENQLDWRRDKFTPMTVCKRDHVLAEVGVYSGNRCRQCRIERARRIRAQEVMS